MFESTSRRVHGRRVGRSLALLVFASVGAVAQEEVARRGLDWIEAQRVEGGEQTGLALIAFEANGHGPCFSPAMQRFARELLASIDDRGSFGGERAQAAGTFGLSMLRVPRETEIGAAQPRARERLLALEGEGRLRGADRPTTVKRSYTGLAQHRHPQKMFRADFESNAPLSDRKQKKCLF